MTTESFVEVRRGNVTESVHGVHVAVWRAERLVARSGDDAVPTFFRSASKPFQALPLVEDGVADAFGLTQEELALCCASHSSQVEHVAVARGILEKAGADPSALACGGHWPLRDEETRRLNQEGRLPGALESNCSGKHAGMLALAVHHGWPLEGYHAPDHPVQRRMAREICRWTGRREAELGTGVDGCGVVCFAVPLHAMAAAFARFAGAVREGAPAARVFEAMTSHPFMVGGTDRLCSDLMAARPGLMAKLGAEGVYVLALSEEGVGVALKVPDGARRAVEPAAVAVLDELGLLEGPALGALSRHRFPAIRNTRGERVGEIIPHIRLETTSR